MINRITQHIMSSIPLGDGNAAKARYNMQADSYQESVWVDKWRDDIALFLIKQQWSIPSVGELVS